MAKIPEMSEAIKAARVELSAALPEAIALLRQCIKAKDKRTALTAAREILSRTIPVLPSEPLPIEVIDSEEYNLTWLSQINVNWDAGRPYALEKEMIEKEKNQNEPEPEIVSAPGKAVIRDHYGEVI